MPDPGAGDERAGRAAGADRRPGLRAGRSFGRRPVGNIRKLPDGGYRLRFAVMAKCGPHQSYVSRADAERALWAMAAEGRADFTHDRRYRALVLLATFASLRWGEATALRRCDLDFDRGSCPCAGRLRRALNRGNADRAAEVEGGAARRRHPRGDYPGPARASGRLRQGRAGRAGLPRREGRSAAAEQLQQDVRLAGRGADARRPRACISTTFGTPATTSRPVAAPGSKI